MQHLIQNLGFYALVGKWYTFIMQDALVQGLCLLGETEDALNMIEERGPLAILTMISTLVVAALAYIYVDEVITGK